MNNKNESKSLVSEKGQVTIPKVLRDALGIRMGTVLTFTLQNGKLYIQKAVSEDPIVKWRGKGMNTKFKTTDSYMEKIRGAYRS